MSEVCALWSSHSCQTWRYFIFFFLIFVRIISSLWVLVSLAYLVFFKPLDFSYIVSINKIIFGFLMLQFEKGGLNFLNLHLVNMVWKFNLKHNEEVSKFVWVLVERHALFLNCKNLFWLDHLTSQSLDFELSAIKKINDKLETAQ